jgi:hypothetical protein
LRLYKKRFNKPISLYVNKNETNHN